MQDEYNLNGHAVKGNVIYGPLNGNTLSFSLEGQFVGMRQKDRSMRDLRIAQTKSMRCEGGLIVDEASNEERLIAALFRDAGLIIDDKLHVGDQIHEGLQRFRDQNGRGIGDPNPVAAELRSLNSNSHRTAQPTIIRALHQILSEEKPATAARLIDRFTATLEGVRKINGFEQDFIPPDRIAKSVTELSKELGRPPSRNELAERMGIFVTAPEKFVNCIEELCQELGRPPTKDDLAKRLKKTPSNVTKLCKKTGFEWLPAKNNAPKEWFYPKSFRNVSVGN